MSVRKAHNSGRNHERNVLDYYQQIGHEKAQSVIDSITSSYAAEGQAGSNPMLAPPGGAAPGFPPPFGFPPPPFGMPGIQPGGPSFMPPPAGRGLPFPPFPPNGNAPPMPGLPGGMPFPPPGGLPFPPQGFPPPGGMGMSPGALNPFAPPQASPGPGGFPPPPMGFGGPMGGFGERQG